MSITCNDCGHVNPNSRITCTQCGKQLPYTPSEKKKPVDENDAAYIMGVSKLDRIVSAINLVLAALNIFAVVRLDIDITVHIFVLLALICTPVVSLVCAWNNFFPGFTLAWFRWRGSFYVKNSDDAEPADLLIGLNKLLNWLACIVNIVALVTISVIFISSLF